MTNEESASGSAAGSSGGRKPRQGSGNSPVGSTLSIILAVVAVVAGFLILNNITDDGGSDSTGSITDPAPDAGDETGEEEADETGEDDEATGPTTTEPTPSTTFEIVTDGATVVVANANGISGSAGRMSTRLENRGFTMGEPANASNQRENTVVQFDASIASAEAVAESVAFLMGGVNVRRMPSPPNVDGGDIGGAGVLVMLGSNEADQTLNQLQRNAEGEATGEAPAPSGSAGDESTDDTGDDTTGDDTTDDDTGDDTTGDTTADE